MIRNAITCVLMCQPSASNAIECESTPAVISTAIITAVIADHNAGPPFRVGKIGHEIVRLTKAGMISSVHCGSKLTQDSEFRQLLERCSETGSHSATRQRQHFFQKRKMIARFFVSQIGAANVCIIIGAAPLKFVTETDVQQRVARRRGLEFRVAAVEIT